MTWVAFHHRGDVLRNVVDEANRRRDGVLPTELPGITETFGDELALVTALQLRWSTRLAGHVELALSELPDDLETAVVTAWRATAGELAGVRQVLDAQRETAGPELADALEKARRKDAVLMAAMAGLASPSDPSAVTIGKRLEQDARAGYRPHTAPKHLADDPAGRTGRPTLVERIKSHVSAA